MHDVALLQLGEEVQWTDTAWPACLPTSTGTKGYTTFKGREATAAGWGWTNEDSNKGKGKGKVLCGSSRVLARPCATSPPCHAAKLP